MAIYYVDAQGDDANPGSKAKPWRTAGKASGHCFRPGDKLLFRGGQRFPGALKFYPGNSGTAEKPVTVSSFGAGRAVLMPGPEEEGLRALNAGGLRIDNIDFQGPGRDESQTDGILFNNDLAGDVKLGGVSISRAEVSGFGNMGILLQGRNGGSGYRGVRITGCSVHDNRIDGIVTYGARPTPLAVYALEDLYIGNCVAYNQRGGRGRKGHSGSGIKLSGVNRGLVEHCIAFNNGEYCDSPSGGPIGIWCYECNEIVMQFCEAHHNHTDNLKDGGGFDFDGGVTNSVFQYNYSHDNDGAGFLICQFRSATNPFANNVVRYNLSVDDGRKNSFGSVEVWGAGPDNDMVTDCDIYNNTFLMSPAPAGTPSVIHLLELSYRNMRFRNNIFIARDGLPLVSAPAGVKDVIFQGNCYWALDGEFLIDWEGTRHGNLESWREAAGQEKLEGAACGLAADPGLNDPYAKPTLDDTRKLKGLRDFRLKKGSPCIDAGLNLKRRFGIKPGERDFWGNKIPRGKHFDVGAHEF